MPTYRHASGKHSHHLREQVNILEGGKILLFLDFNIKKERKKMSLKWRKFSQLNDDQ